MSVREKPRPTEFMERGYSVADMNMILAAWGDLTDEEIERLGFVTVSPQAALRHVRSLLLAMFAIANPGLKAAIRESVKFSLTNSRNTNVQSEQKSG